MSKTRKIKNKSKTYSENNILRMMKEKGNGFTTMPTYANNLGEDNLFKTLSEFEYFRTKIKTFTNHELNLLIEYAPMFNQMKSQHVNMVVHMMNGVLAGNKRQKRLINTGVI